MIVLGDNSLPDSWLASCVVNYNNLAISKLFQLVHDNCVFLVLLYVITSFHKRCRTASVHVDLQLPKSKGSVVHHNAPYLVRLKVTMDGVSVGIDEARRGVSENGAEANTIAIFAGVG